MFRLEIIIAGKDMANEGTIEFCCFENSVVVNNGLRCLAELGGFGGGCSQVYS